MISWSVNISVALLLLFGAVCSAQGTGKSCVDRDLKIVPDGQQFHPRREDPCLSCLCNNGKEDMCMTPSCAAPQCSVFKMNPEKCCEFICQGEEDSEEDRRHHHRGRDHDDDDDDDDDSSEEEGRHGHSKGHHHGWRNFGSWHMLLMLVIAAFGLAVIVVAIIMCVRYRRARWQQRTQDVAAFDNPAMYKGEPDIYKESVYPYTSLEKVPIDEKMLVDEKPKGINPV